MTKFLTTASVLMIIGSLASASAATIYNSDKTPSHLTFMPHHGKVVHMTVAAGKDAKLNCARGGVLTLGKDTEKCDAKTTKITIKNGAFAI